MAIDPKTYIETYGEEPHLSEVAPTDPPTRADLLKEAFGLCISLFFYFIIAYLVLLPIVSGIVKKP